MMKKSILLVLSLFLLALALAGCAAGNAKTIAQTKAPAVTFTPQTATAAPMNTMAPVSPAQTQDGPAASGAMDNAGTTNSAGMTNGVNAASSGSMTPADAGRLAEKIAEAVERISEVDDAEVIVRDHRALIAVEFDDQYSAGLDERMEKQIVEAAQKIDQNLTEVKVTDDGTLYGQVKSLAERIGKATGFDELAEDIGDLWDRVTGR